jgi:hypothetical protein
MGKREKQRVPARFRPHKNNSLIPWSIRLLLVKERS